ncbi:DUF4190 domain-containing protein [Glycomyces paridis]|uniref:DUF4190 domain-containing protein n=1 Tax=Glycomyces paridis TaxID=2126555 RepID=A0A4S8PJA1_9ACTN|nr:DUF4190 domain-containing protein [Glycomyces paridis]THV30757.1 DUF4190 domain-containing protein [Glycomyces paridis]
MSPDDVPSPDPENPSEPPAYPVYPPVPGEGAPHPGTNGMAIASLVVGIVGLCFCFGFIAIPLGSAARRRIETTGQSGDGLAIAGIVLGWLSVGFIALRILRLMADGPGL